MRNAFMKHINYFVFKYIFIHVCLFFRMALVESSDKNIDLHCTHANNNHSDQHAHKLSLICAYDD